MRGMSYKKKKQKNNQKNCKKNSFCCHFFKKSYILIVSNKFTQKYVTKKNHNFFRKEQKYEKI